MKQSTPSRTEHSPAVDLAHQVCTEERIAPRKGQRITYEGREVGNVLKVEGDICHVRYDDGITHQFIWRHPEGLNTLHNWPTKPRNSHVHPLFRAIIVPTKL